jgi:hypothetical protein
MYFSCQKRGQRNAARNWRLAWFHNDELGLYPRSLVYEYGIIRPIKFRWTRSLKQLRSCLREFRPLGLNGARSSVPSPSTRTANRDDGITHSAGRCVGSGQDQAQQQTVTAVSVSVSSRSLRRRPLLSAVIPAARVGVIDRSEPGPIGFGVVGPSREGEWPYGNRHVPENTIALRSSVAKD